MISYLMVISVFLTIVISMWLYIRVPSSNIEEVMKPIIKSDDKLLLKSKIAYYDYKEKPKNHIKNLIKYRERLIFRYQYYRKIKNNNIEKTQASQLTILSIVWKKSLIFYKHYHPSNKYH